jgi:hypothetical protein
MYHATIFFFFLPCARYVQTHFRKSKIKNQKSKIGEGGREKVHRKKKSHSLEREKARITEQGIKDLDNLGS